MKQLQDTVNLPYDISDMIIQSSMWSDLTHTLLEVKWNEKEEPTDSKTIQKTNNQLSNP